MERKPVGQSLVRELRHALHHLYDPAVLRHSRLVAVFGLETRRSPASALRELLTSGIRALRPGDEVPFDSRAWRIYQVMNDRYVEQSSQVTVAASLGLSVRQVRREERAGEQVLAEYLWKHHDLERKAQDLLPASDDQVPDRQQELQWLTTTFPAEVEDPAHLIESAVRTVRPMAEARQVRLECQIQDGLPLLSGQLVAVRQAVLGLLSAAVRAAPSGLVRVVVSSDRQNVVMQVCAGGDQAGPCPPNSETLQHIEMARQLIDTFGGVLQVTPLPDRTFSATLMLPARSQIPVLVLDDNQDTLRLLERYLSGTRYRFIGTGDPEEVVELATHTAPRVIVMDIMLPGIHDWELLGRLREHPEIRGIPIVVCTILPQEQLALALGAAGFLRKPVTRDAFLAALDRHLPLEVPSRESPSTPR